MMKLLLLLPLLLLTVGCATLQKPSAEIKSMSLGDVDTQGLTMNFAIDVSNPNKTSLPVPAADYKLSLGGVQVIEDTAHPTGDIPANGTATVTLPVRLKYDTLVAARDAIIKGGGDVPYAIDTGLSFGGSAKTLGQTYRVPLQYSGVLPLRPVLQNPEILAQNPTVQRLAAEMMGRLFGH